MKTFSTTDLVRRIARELKLPDAEARALLDRVVDELKRELKSGHSVVLPQFLSVQVQLGEATAAPTQAGGKLDLPADRQVQLTLDETLRQAVEGPTRYHIALVVAEKDPAARAMAAQLSTARTTVDILSGAEADYAQLQRHRPDVLVLDGNADASGALCASIKKNRETSLTSVIRICTNGYSPDKVRELTVLPDECIREPFELADFIRLVESELARAGERRQTLAHALHFRLPTRREHIEQANDLLDQLLRSSGLVTDACDSLAVAFREALDNAARHGNQNRESACLDVQYSVDHEEVTIIVTDEGEGFDTDVYLSRGLNGIPVSAARERNEMGYRGGLGIMLMLRCVDRLEYNCTGNRVTLSRYLREE